MIFIRTFRCDAPQKNKNNLIKDDVVSNISEQSAEIKTHSVAHSDCSSLRLQQRLPRVTFAPTPAPFISYILVSKLREAARQVTTFNLMQLRRSPSIFIPTKPFPDAGSRNPEQPSKTSQVQTLPPPPAAQQEMTL